MSRKSCVIQWCYSFARSFFSNTLSHFMASLLASPLKFQANASAPVMCLLEQADYQECLHREKLKRRIAAKCVEVKEVLHPKPSGGDHGHH